jgi:hypothetical protein
MRVSSTARLAACTMLLLTSAAVITAVTAQCNVFSMTGSQMIEVLLGI